MLRVISVLCIASALSLSAYASDDDPFNVDFVCGWGGYYRPMEWTPIEIQVGGGSELTEPFAGSITISTRQDGLNTMNITHEFVLTPEIRLYLPLVTKMAYAVSECDVRIANERGRTQWQHDFDLYDLTRRYRFMTAVRDHDLLIGFVGRAGFGLLRLPRQSICEFGVRRGKVYVGDKVPRMVPWDWTGFVSLDVLVLYDPDWGLFRPQQLKAIAEWVSNGGRLLLVLGNHPLVATNPIASLLPCTPSDRKDVVIPPEILEKWGLRTDRTETVTAWSLFPKSGARLHETETNHANECLFATGYAGFGRVGILPFDPALMSSEQAVNSASFWVSRLRAIQARDLTTLYANQTRRTAPELGEVERSLKFVEDPDESLKDDRNRHGRYEVGGVYTANNSIMEFLYQEIKPLSIWWVIFLLISLAFLLGPFDYKLLKRLGRLPMTWLTCTFWIILFTLGAYFGVQYLRAGQLELRVVSVLDGIKGSDHTWSTSYCGLFAPKSSDYRLKGLQKHQWWSGIAPTGQSIGMRGQQAIGKRIYCFQHDGGNLPYSLPVNIWDVQCFLKESSVQQLPFDAKVERQGKEYIVEITNKSKSRILSGYVVVFGSHGFRFGPVRAGATKQFRSQLIRMNAWEGHDSKFYRNQNPRRRSPIPSFKKESAFFAQGCLQRTRSIETYMDRGAVVVCVEYDQPAVSFALDGRSYSTNHIQFARLVVFPTRAKMR